MKRGGLCVCGQHEPQRPWTRLLAWFRPVKRYPPALRKIRKVRAAREAAQIAAMYQRFPWFADYMTMRSGRGWQAVHLASGTVLPPARTPEALGRLILADVQSRPVPVPDSGEPEDRTRLDIRRARPYANRGPR